MINYALCPAVTVEDIVRQVLQAAAWLYRNGGNFGAPHGGCMWPATRPAAISPP